MTTYIDKLLEEGKEVLKSRVPAGSPMLYDNVDNIKYQTWAMNCITLLQNEAPEHVSQIKSIYKPKYNLINHAEQIFGILASASEYLKHKSSQKNKTPNVLERPASHFNLEFLHVRLKEKCADHFHSEKYDDAILNACKVIEVYTRELAGLSESDIGVNLMRKAFNPQKPILKYSKITSEQEALMNLFVGFVGVFKNPQSHRFIGIKDPWTAFEVLNFANHLCKILEGIK